MSSFATPPMPQTGRQMVDNRRIADALEFTELVGKPVLLATHMAFALRGKLPWSST
jgi:hypothetical protein